MQLNETSPGARKVLLTGGTGFLGSHIARFFKGKGFDVTILKRSTSKLERLNKIESELTLVNIEDFEGGEFDLFIHAASSYGRNGESSQEIEQSNIDFPMKLLSTLNLKKLHFINIGTSLPFDVNIYSKTKHQFVEKVRSTYPSLKFSNLIAEQFYGPHDGTFLSFIIEKLKAKVENLSLTMGEQLRDVIYYEDVITGIFTIYEKEIAGDFPVGTGKTIRIKDIVKKIALELNNSTTRLDFGKLNYREKEVMESVANIEKLENLGWSAEYDFPRGLRKTLENW